MSNHKMRLLLTVTLLISCNWLLVARAAGSSSSDELLEARDDVSSQEEDFISTSYVLPNQIFNDGKPYYASKDPISGQLDFSAKKPAGIETAVNEVINENKKIVLGSSSPNIHDYLNLPVKYSSSKFVYPLVSSSYANLKYQGSNKNYITHKKPISVLVPFTPAPNVHTFNDITTTKLMAIPPTESAAVPVGVSASSKRPTTNSSTNTPTTTTATTTKKPTTSAIPTLQPSTTKYNTTRKPMFSTTNIPHINVSTTRRKFIPTKKQDPPTTLSTFATSMNSLDQRFLNSTVMPKPTQTTTLSTQQPIPAVENTSKATKFVSTTIHPIIFTEKPITTPANNFTASSNRISNLEAVDVYQTIEHKNVDQKIKKKPSITLDEIFNSLAEEESAVVSNNQGNQGFDTQGNLLQPITPSKPSPFTMQQLPQVPRPQTTRPSFPTTSIPVKEPTSQLSHSAQDEQLISGNQENFHNEYVSYQVQQPKMQYRPTISNIVLSPNQNSASFVLGSQQQISSNNYDDQNPLLNKQQLVQYGTVINEDITTLQRPDYQQLPAGVNSNFHQNGNFTYETKPIVAGQAALTSAASQSTLKPSPNNMHFQEIPASPSPYQQLPLVSSHTRLKPHVKIQDPQPANSLDTKELSLSTNIRFPGNNEEVLSGPVVASPPAGPQINGHAHPLSLQQIQNSNLVVFPKEKNTNEENNKNDLHTHSDEIQIQQHDVISINQLKQKMNFHQDHITPSQHMEPPSRFPSLLHSSKADLEIQKRPLQPNHPNGPSFNYNDHNRKPPLGTQLLNTDKYLPNILPQFRPNAKSSNGHPSINYNREPGNIRLTGQPTLKRPNTNLQFAHRRQPVLQQKMYSMNHLPEYPSRHSHSHSPEANRRIYRLPSHARPNMQFGDRFYSHRPAHSLRPVDNGYDAEGAADATNITELYKSPQLLNGAAERLPIFEEEDLVINNLSQSLPSNRAAEVVDEAKLEPVVTLQMLQSQKKPASLSDDDSVDGDFLVPSSKNVSKPDIQNGLYVIYPIKDKQLSEESLDTSGTKAKNSLSNVSHFGSSSSGSEYENTPFSIVRDQPQEPILMVKKKRTQSLLQQMKRQKPNKFSYGIEKPALTHSENISDILIAPRIINAYAPDGNETAPIAVAYTPTESNPYKPEHVTPYKYSNVNLATPVITEIRTANMPKEVNHDFDNQEQISINNFMAPFHPSISLSTATNLPASGWSILPPSTDSFAYGKNKINRADVRDNMEINSSAELDSENPDTTTKIFQIDSFQPELQGGFKPIYPPGYKTVGEENHQISAKENNKAPFKLDNHVKLFVDNSSATALPLSSNPTTKLALTSTSTSTVTSTNESLIINTTSNPLSNAQKPTNQPSTEINRISSTTSPEHSRNTTNTTHLKETNPSLREKSAFETSLEALLFKNDEKFSADDSHKKQPKTISTSHRNIPRMGPRQLRF